MILALVLAYLLGSVPVGAWVARARGVDIRKVGSGNPGATNVQRTLGWGPGLFVALFDIFKGVLAVLLARHVLNVQDPFIVALCGLLAVLGHNFSVFLGFRGGKGVATSFGTVAIIDPVVGAGTFVIALFCMFVTRFVSAGSLVGAVTVMTLVTLLQRPVWEVIVTFTLSLLLIWQHRDNIKRLRAGNERRFGEKSST